MCTTDYLGYEVVELVPEHQVAALVAERDRLREALVRLIECPELQWDEMDAESRAAIIQARAALAQSKGDA